MARTLKLLAMMSTLAHYTRHGQPRAMHLCVLICLVGICGMEEVLVSTTAMVAGTSSFRPMAHRPHPRQPLGRS